MDCKAARKLISARADREPLAAGELEQHLAEGD